MIHHAKTSAPADVFCVATPSASHSLGRFSLLSLCDIFPRPGEVDPQGDAFELCRKLLRYRQKPSPWGRWHRAAMTKGVSVSISMFCTNGAFSPCEKCEKSLSIKSVMCEDATKIYLNKESAPCSRRQKAVCFKQTGQRPAQREKARNTM